MKLAVTRDEAAAMASVSVDTIDRAIADGSLRVRRFGRLVRIPVRALEEWVNDGINYRTKRKANAAMEVQQSPVVGGAGRDGSEGGGSIGESLTDGVGRDRTHGPIVGGFNGLVANASWAIAAKVARVRSIGR
jgi:excisionase family DNA binding protein